MSTDNNTPTPAGAQPANPNGATGSGPDNTVRAVWGLAREVEGLRTQFEDQVGELRAKVEPLTAMPEKVSTLARTVRAIADQLAGAEGEVPSWSWLDLPADLDRAQAMLTDLTVWLRRIFLRYPDAAGVLPECWMWHPDIVEELLWLAAAWHTAYRDEDATVARAADWHDRYRPGVVRRIKGSAGGCSLENHEDGGPLHRPAPRVPMGEGLAPIALWWAEERDNPAPVPTAEQLAAAQAAARQRRGGARR
ncbi:hypothetical protein [Amycolatopsis sp. FDAARGOS 1241]|uniref:hypothetical protein n=1 Tax=Amycolatopsis sp. FDAARGOS 1241 TaxID=2778070 RepID=UPI001EF1B8D1|nr:hypothetical protein [Amycolatopsis sp. FDAARGOS 1241]